MFETELGDQELLEQVVLYYREHLKDYSPAQEYLLSRGLTDPDILETFEIGFADRQFGLTLPKRTSKAGKTIRNQLQRIGIFRASGHGQFTGCITFPIRTTGGTIANLYGRKISRNLPRGTELHMQFPEAKGTGIFNVRVLETADEIILTDSVFNALSFWTAGLRNVTCALGELSDELLNALAPVSRIVLAYRHTDSGNQAAELAAEKLVAAGHEVFRVAFPITKDANDVLMAEGSEGLVALVRQAGWEGTGPSVAVQAAELPEPPVPQPPAPEPPAPEPIASAHPAQKTPSVEAKLTETPSGETEITVIFDDRRYRIRGLEKNLSFDRLKVNLLVARDNLTHINTFDLYNARMRKSFVKEAAEELYVDERTIKDDLSRLLLKLEELQQEIIARATASTKPVPVELTDRERKAALELLKEKHLTDRILADYDRCGLVGEETGKLVCYLACVSRLMPRPLAILIQSSSASGKTSLMDATLSFMPPEETIRYSAMTGQSLFYMGQHEMKQKILAVAEEAGVSEASYALKILQSDGKLRIASAEKDSRTGRQKTQDYQAEGPVMMFLTTTNEYPDPELQNRCITLRVNESTEQTEAIHARQRAEYSGAGQRQDGEAIMTLHQNAQRLLKPYPVVIPWADRLTFRKDQVRMRRDHTKYLSLIASITLLHQYQRKTVTGSDGKKRLVATIEDIELAGRLASQAMGQSLDSLLPQTRQLLVLLDDYVTQRCLASRIPRCQLRLTQRELRETLGWSDFTIRKHLRRLVELEYVLTHRTGRGNGRAYELIYDGQGRGGQGREGTPFMMGIIDAAKLRREPQAMKKEQYVNRNEPLGGRNEPHASPRSAPFEPHSSGVKMGVSTSPVMDLQPTS